jgi:glyoxylase-like metal-dependent hydrolase (beta-lactamase superfamily II)
VPANDVASVSYDLVCHCLLIETPTALALVDTGLGLHDLAVPDRIASTMRSLFRPRIEREDAAIEHVRRLGYNPSDVRDIILTQLSFEHAGGLSDFPKARVHVMEAEHMASRRRDISLGRSRYRPAQWSHSPDWVLYSGAGERWLGFECVRNLTGLPPDVLLVPLVGFTPGHAGVAVKVDDRWQLHAGDAFFDHAEIDVLHPRCPPPLASLEHALGWNNDARRDNQQRLRELISAHGEVDVFCSHDPQDYFRFALEPFGAWSTPARTGTMLH